MPTFTDRLDERGGVAPGLFPGLTAVLGAGSFNSGGGTKYAALRASGSVVGRELTAAWQLLQAVAGVNVPAAAALLQPGSAAVLLAASADEAGLEDDGTSRPQLQKKLAEEVHRYVHHSLDAEILALPTTTEALVEERRTWAAVDGVGGKVAGAGLGGAIRH